jgi:2-phosphosulfolactate phosphatase
LPEKRDGTVLDFADFGNSPENFEPELIAGRTVVYTTTNGTRTIKMASDYHLTLIGSFLNADSLVEFLKDSHRDVLILCAGWKDRFNLEDSVCAGYIAAMLLESRAYTTECDSAKAAVDLWSLARVDLRAFIDKSSHRHRLKSKNLDHCIDFCLTRGFTRIVPMLKNGELIAAGSSYLER